MVIFSAVEGVVDEAVARRLIIHVGGQPGSVYGKQGKSQVRNRLDGYNNAARHAPWFILVDLNGEEDCAPRMRGNWLVAPSRLLCFRIAVREVESWLLADPATLATYLSVPRSRLPENPETLRDPKTTMVNVARSSRRRAIQQDIVPREGSQRRVGPAYTSRLVEYVRSQWRPQIAAQSSDSLRRAIDCLTRLVHQAK